MHIVRLKPRLCAHGWKWQSFVLQDGSEIVLCRL
eukprot:COSAG03_NODE_24380_length_272_cov_1.485549_1_plen_33_part_10